MKKDKCVVRALSVLVAMIAIAFPPKETWGFSEQERTASLCLGWGLTTFLVIAVYLSGGRIGLNELGFPFLIISLSLGAVVLTAWSLRSFDISLGYFRVVGLVILVVVTRFIPKGDLGFMGVLFNLALAGVTIYGGAKIIA